ncbi:hypothetical protein LTR22_026217 [Elasticomyces elasticus]|nr:hypothetical protein LTR22_026217 [Elasticomyces elasticus]
MATLAIGIDLFASPCSAAVYETTSATSADRLEIVHYGTETALQHIPVDKARKTSTVIGSSTTLVGLDSPAASLTQSASGLSGLLMNASHLAKGRAESDTLELAQIHMHLVDITASILVALLDSLKLSRVTTVGSVVLVIPAHTAASSRRMFHDAARIVDLDEDKIRLLTAPVALVLAYNHETDVHQHSKFLVLTGDAEDFHVSVVEQDHQQDIIAVLSSTQGTCTSGEDLEQSARDTVLATDVESCATLALQHASAGGPATIIIVAKAFTNKTLVQDRLSLLCSNAAEIDITLDASGLAAVRGAAIQATQWDSQAANMQSSGLLVDDKNLMTLIARFARGGKEEQLVQAGAFEEDSTGGFIIYSDFAGGAAFDIDILEIPEIGDKRVSVAMIRVEPNVNNSPSSRYKLVVSRDVRGVVQLAIKPISAQDADAYEVTEPPLGLNKRDIKRSKELMKTTRDIEAARSTAWLPQ